MENDLTKVTAEVKSVIGGEDLIVLTMPRSVAETVGSLTALVTGGIGTFDEYAEPVYEALDAVLDMQLFVSIKPHEMFNFSEKWLRAKPLPPESKKLLQVDLEPGDIFRFKNTKPYVGILAEYLRLNAVSYNSEQPNTMRANFSTFRMHGDHNGKEVEILNGWGGEPVKK